MKKNVWKKLIGKKSTGIIITILTFVIVFCAIFTVSNLTIASDSLAGIVNIRNDSVEGEYRVLEIVPSIDVAEFGFLVGGEEPLDSTTLFSEETNEWRTWQEYLNENVDTMSELDRYNYINALRTANQEYISDSRDLTKPMWYEPYVETGVTAEDYDGVFQGGNTPAYGWLEYYDNTTGGTDGWNAKFSTVGSGKTYTDLVGETTPYYIVDTDNTNSELQITVTDVTSATPTYPDHYYIYKKEPAGYVCAGTFGELRADYNDDNGLVDPGEDEDSLDNYYILKFRMLKEGDWSTSTGTGPIAYAASDFIFLEENAPYSMSDDTSKLHQDVLKPSITVYYKGGLFSNEMFKCYSLDIDADDVANYNVNVQTVTAGELANMNSEELTTYLSTVDFIYLNAGVNSLGSGIVSYLPENISSGLDLDAEAVKAIFEKICNEKTPCIVDNYLKELASPGFDRRISNTYAYALACMLMQSNYRNLLTDGVLTHNIKDNLATWAASVVTTNFSNYVNGNVMVINSISSYGKLTDRYYGTEAEAYDMENADISAAYKAVLAEIRLENLYRAADQTAGYTELPTAVHKGTVVRYIINYVAARSVETKTAIQVLEIQPGMVAHPDNSDNENDKNELSPSKVRTWLGVDNNVTVNIKTVTTNEFVGRIEDINSEYDLIYIGADIYKLNNDGSNTVYRDTTMNNLIYTSVGDQKKIKAHFAGLLDTDYFENRTKIYTEIEARYNGNDISADKHNDLVDYVKGTYPIVVADKLCTNDTKPSSTTVDNCTYLYSFLKEHLDEPNVFRVSEVSSGKNSEFKFYANRGKLEIGEKVLAGNETTDPGKTPFVIPGEVDEDDTTDGNITYISKENGKYFLRYKFTITNNGAVFENTTYKAALFLDSNADGKFSKEYEEISDITITHVASGKNITNGHLLADEQYILTRQVPDSYAGLLTWKVEVSQTSNEYIRDNLTGYTKLYDPDRGAVTIKVLHVHKDSGSYLNLETGIGNGPTNSGSQEILSTLVWGGEYNDNYYPGIASEYKFEFTSISNKAFNKSFEEKKLYTSAMVDTGKKFNLMDYDMFVLGFYDSYSVRGTSSQDISAEAINGTDGIKEFIDSGKSVLFAHDTTSFTAIPDYTQVLVDTNNDSKWDDWETAYTSPYDCAVWAYTLNKNIRDMVGLDAYGVSIDTKDGLNYSKIHSGVGLKSTDTDNALFNALTNTLDGEGHYKIGLKALAYKPKSDRKETVPETQGLTYNWMQQWPSTISTNTAVYRTGTGSYKTVTKAVKVNEGQITTYPYWLDDNITTATTHSQYYTLDLNADDDNDNETDLVVWYTLSGHNQYDYSPKDVVNNYYIYNKGNITYTGIGHSHNTTTIQEGMLFINTMVAAYNSSTKDPDILFYDSENTTIPSTTYYEYGDVDNDIAFRNNGQKAYFMISDTNIIRGSKSASVEYCVALKKSVSDTLTDEARNYTISGTNYKLHTYKDTKGVEHLYKDEKGCAYIVLTGLETFTSNDVKVTDVSQLECGTLYYVNIPPEVFDLNSVSGENVNTFMVATKTTLKRKGNLTNKEFITETGVTRNSIDFVHVELFPLD